MLILEVKMSFLCFFALAVQCGFSKIFILGKNGDSYLKIYPEVENKVEVYKYNIAGEEMFIKISVPKDSEPTIKYNGRKSIHLTYAGGTSEPLTLTPKTLSLPDRNSPFFGYVSVEKETKPILYILWGEEETFKMTASDFGEIVAKNTILMPQALIEDLSKYQQARKEQAMDKDGITVIIATQSGKVTKLDFAYTETQSLTLSEPMAFTLTVQAQQVTINANSDYRFPMDGKKTFALGKVSFFDKTQASSWNFWKSLMFWMKKTPVTVARAYIFKGLDPVTFYNAYQVIKKTPLTETNYNEIEKKLGGAVSGTNV